MKDMPSVRKCSTAGTDSLAIRAAFLITALLLCFAFAKLMAGAPPADQSPSPERDLPPAARQAIKRGIEYLVKTQRPDGSWGTEGAAGRYPTAMTALAGLALLADGNLPSSGHHAVAVRRAVDYLLSASDPITGLIGGQETGRPMFGHGYAMLFLAQVYGSEEDANLRKRIRETLQKAVELSVKAQNTWGGWYYTPTTENDEGAVTITQMQGLRACADAGIVVPPKSIEAAIGYIRKSVNPDGGIAYRASAAGESRPGITCAALAVLYSAGQYDSELVKNALAYALDNVPMSGVTARGGGHFFYAHLYLSQVMYIRGGEEWKQYFERIRNWLLTAQNPDGSWEGDYIGPTYGSAIALLILQLPYGTLPVAQR